MTVPSIKGSVFAAVVESVAKLLARGDVSRDEASRWLEPGDLALLDQTIVPASWYDIRSYDRMNRMLLELEGGGAPEYLREQGRRTARRLQEGGIYAQLEYLSRAEVMRKSDPEQRFQAFGRDLRILNTLSRSILNFTHWTAQPDPDQARRYRIEISDAAAMPESLCWRSDGFVNEMASVHDQPDLWRWERPRPDLVLFRMLRDV